ncbi:MULTISPECIES: arginine--tRNA ligase [Candidatus Ichthyocystis]|uniref:Arginine--tRNA ligase n=1 Tax=Candidatus Ichthyocystis hellenicum TaxID=1561003 RepID=A0A0S4M1Z3_9BURK|nr:MULTISPECIES: arginine--tRNA ligase [Ichthyocystis]CUT17039.1 Arginyl-tRNA synthetase [Candidatus Ichthyocystis hellenicum]
MLNPLKLAVVPLLHKALLAAYPQCSVSNIILDRPKDPSWGDISSNIALQLAKQLKQPPKTIAKNIVNYLVDNVLIASVSVAENGFINFKLSSSAFMDFLEIIDNKKDSYGCVEDKKGKVIVEFVSANPTGPLHVGHGRQGAIGDVLSNLMKNQGWEIHREFYYNDAGNQIDKLAISVQARIKGFSPEDTNWPNDGYQGDYIIDIASNYMNRQCIEVDGITVEGKADPDDIEAICNFAVSFLRKEQNADLDLFDIVFDQFYLESSLYKEGTVNLVVNRLMEQNKTYEHENALWLKTTEYGDSKDRVMRKTDGSFTYFVPDVAYHLKKWKRGFKKAINIQGTDHHGTMIRVRAGLQGLGYDIPEDYPTYLMHSMVKVFRDSKEVKISKRAGSYVTLRDLIKWVGKDAVRFFLVSRKPDSELLFDIDLALKKSEDNPVFYVQYAHARAHSILNQAHKVGVSTCNLSGAELPELSMQACLLINQLAEFPDMLKKCVDELSPHLLPNYLRNLAATFHGFYNAERVLVKDSIMRAIRMRMVIATKQVLKIGFTMLGISAPEQM